MNNDELSWKKAFSGRFIFTVVVALVFAYTAVSGSIQEETIKDVIQMVAMFYFLKKTEN